MKQLSNNNKNSNKGLKVTKMKEQRLELLNTIHSNISLVDKKALALEYVLNYMTKYDMHNGRKVGMIATISEGNVPTFDIVNGFNALPNGAMVSYPIDDIVKVDRRRKNPVVTVDKDVASKFKGFIVSHISKDLEYSLFGLKLTSSSAIVMVKDSFDYDMVKLAFGGIRVGRHSYIDYTNASSYVDGFYFTSSVVKELSLSEKKSNLQGLERRGQFLLLNRCYDDKIADVKIPQSLADEWLIDYRDARAIKVVKPQYKIRKFSVMDITIGHVTNPNTGEVVVNPKTGIPNNYMILPKGKGVSVKISENRLLRTYCANEDRIANNFFVFNAVPNLSPAMKNALTGGKPNTKAGRKIINNEVKRLEEVAVNAIGSYIYDEETQKFFKVCIQSPAQARVGKFFFTSENREEVRDKMLYGFKFPSVTSIAKQEGRIGLCLTNATPVSVTPSITVIPDFSTMVETDVITVVEDKNGNPTFNENGIVATTTGRQKIEITPTDGQGTVTVRYSAMIAKDLGLISNRELEIFLAEYTTISELRTNERLMKIFNKIPSAFQIRNAGDKGLLVRYPHDEIVDKNGNHPYTDDIYMCESMRKYQLSKGDYSNVSFEIASYNKDKKKISAMAYQFINTLNISAETLIEIAKESLDKIDSDVLVNPVSALKFLGLTSSLWESDSDTALNSKLTQVISANPDTLKDKWTKVKFQQLLEKFVKSIGFGKLPVQGDYYYLATDPRTMFPETRDSALKIGEYYLNGDVDTYAGFRSPLIHKSEAQKFNMVNDEELWHLKDIAVFNHYEPKLASMGGADTDGDTARFTKDTRIVNALPKYPYLIIDKGYKGKDGINNIAGVVEHYKRTAVKSQVGIITQYATVYTDLEFHLNSNKDEYIIPLRYVQGWEIDKAKTGQENEIPEVLEIELVPDWLAELKVFLGRNPVKEENIYESNSPIAKLNRFVKEYFLNFGKNTETLDLTMSLISNGKVDYAEYERVRYTVAEYEKTFRTKLAQLMQEFSDEESKTQRATHMQNLFNEYNVKLKSLSDNYYSVAVACYNACYNREDKRVNSYSFPWSCMFEEMLELLQDIGAGKRLIRLPEEFDNEVVEAIEVLPTKMLKINGKIVRETEIPVGKYEVLDIEDRKFILANRTSLILPEEPSQVIVNDNKRYEFNITGIRYGYLNDVLEAFDKVTTTSFILQEVEGAIKVVCENKILGQVKDEFKAVYSLLKGKLLMATNDLESKGKLYKKNGSLYQQFNVTVKVVGDSTPEDEVKTVSHVNGNFVNMETGEIVDCNSNSFIVSSSPAEYEYSDYSYDYSEPVYADNSTVTTSNTFVDATQDVVSIVSNDVVEIASSEVISVASEVSTVSTTPQPVLDQTILSALNLNTPYWNVISLEPTANVDSFEYKITNSTNFSIGAEIGFVNAYNNGSKFTFNVAIGKSGLEIVNPAGSQEFQNWVLRVISYYATAERLK